jgi:hypothetical protein
VELPEAAGTPSAAAGLGRGCAGAGRCFSPDFTPRSGGLAHPVERRLGSVNVVGIAAWLQPAVGIPIH